MSQAFLEYLDQARDRVIELQREMTARPALDPGAGGQGEAAKSTYLLEQLKALGVEDIQVFQATDKRAPDGVRPNIVAKIKTASLRAPQESTPDNAFASENKRKTLWVIGHMDVVPAGELSLWESAPFTLKIDGDFIIGRGVEDNQQAITSAMLVAEALMRSTGTTGANVGTDSVLEFDFGLIFVADEETGNQYGMQFLLEKHPNIFSPGDLILVPDYGESDGSAIEVAEKAQLWLKITVSGKQCHASTPENGINSLRAAAACILAVDEMYQHFPEKNDLFVPPFSTFAPTKKDPNVGNINTIPGKDVFYIDCRIIPGIEIEAVLLEMERTLSVAAHRHGAGLKLEVVQCAPQTPMASSDSTFVRRLAKAVEATYKVTTRSVGIGGGTVAGLLRAAGYEALVWSKIIPNPHTPNERSRISSNIGDAKVMISLLFNEQD